MLTNEDLIYQETPPNLKEISLKLYKEFSVSILFDRKFHYYFNDGSNIILEFREWGIYHMLSIQHIDGKIGKDTFFSKIDDGLELNYFERNNSVKARYKHEKERITLFSCLYFILKNGFAFYVPSGKVRNTKSVEVDYIIFATIQNKGVNIGIRKVGDVYVPMTILIAKSVNPKKYLDETKYKMIRRLEILNNNGHILDTKSYVPCVIL